jgi:capsid assembly protease
MPYPHIVRKVFCEPWCILPDYHESIVTVLNSRLAGESASVPVSSIQVPFTPLAASLGLTPPRERGSRVWTKGKAGVIPVYGIIGSHLSSLEMMCGAYGVEQLQSDVDDAMRDDRIENIIFDFHSPGGHVTGIPETGRMIAELGKAKNTYAFSSGMVASAAYWLASQANHLYGTESSMWGNIGVYLAVVSRKEAMAKAGEKVTLIAAGEHKTMGHPSTELTAEQIQILQASVDDTYKAFTKAVKAKRPDVDKASMQGLIYKGVRAREAKLVDSIVSSLGSLVSKLS